MTVPSVDFDGEIICETKEILENLRNLGNERSKNLFKCQFEKY